MSGAVDYFTHCDSVGIHALCEGEAEVHRPGYLTDLISDRAVDYIGRQTGKAPFLLSVHYTAPHWPWEARGDEADRHSVQKSLRTRDRAGANVPDPVHHHDI